MTVEELIEKLSKYDKNTKVIGADSIEWINSPITEVVDDDHNVNLKIVGWETVLRLK